MAPIFRPIGNDYGYGYGCGYGEGDGGYGYGYGFATVNNSQHIRTAIVGEKKDD